MATAFANITDTHWLESSIRMGRTKGHHSARTMLTPGLARALLDCNPANRPVTPSRVRSYARDIKEGRWVYNGESIVVSDDGLLNDGQHRCLAVIEADTPIDTAIVFGPSYDSRKTTDIGASKNAGSFLGMDGVPYAATIAGIVRNLIAYEQTGGLNLASRITNTEVLDRYAAQSPSFDESAKLTVRFSNRMARMLAPSVFGFCYHICRANSQEKADVYFEQLATGELLAHGDPALTIRNRLLAVGKASKQEKAELVLHGWNAFAKGQKRTFVRSNGQLPPVA